MLVIEQNCGKRYEYSIPVLGTSLGLDNEIVYIQELFLERKNLAYLGSNLYWLEKTHDCKNNCVLIAVRMNLLNAIIIENRIDLITYFYGIVLDITKENIHGKGQKS